MVDPPRRSAIHVLLVEDNPADARLLIEISKPYPSPLEFHHVTTGDEAIAYLRRLETDADPRWPDVVLLDLNLPGRDGRYVLSTIRSDRSLNRLPVIIVTASPLDSDVLHAFDLKADAYLRKPVDLPHLVAAFERIEVGP
jgi:CheY-like chemotaxis protein